MITQNDLQGLLDDALIGEESDEDDFQPFAPAGNDKNDEEGNIFVENIEIKEKKEN